jgi:FkbM family methyltransferase
MLRYPNVTAVQVALAAQAGTAQLHDYLMMSASGSLHYDETMATLQQSQLKADDIAPRIGQRFQAQTFTVDTIPVDDFLSDKGIHRVDLVKMDIEGAELDALRGMQDTIAHSPDLVLIMEYNPHALHAFGHDPAAALAEVVDMGFKQMGQIQSDGQTVNLLGEEERISALTAGLLPNMGVVNLLFSKGSSLENH